MAKKELTEKEQKARALLTRPRLRFEKTRQPAIGDMMPDGSIFIGQSRNGKKKLYAMATDAPLMMTFNEAAQYAATLQAHGHNDWRVPTMDELDILYKNKNEGFLKGTFNETSSSDASRYHAGAACMVSGNWQREFHHGVYFLDQIGKKTSLRCVRG